MSNKPSNEFDSFIRVRAPQALVRRVEKIAVKRTKKFPECVREAVVRYVETEESK